MNQQQSTNCSQLGIASVPIQPWAETYRPEDAFLNGTIFPDLNLPFLGKTARTQSASKGEWSK